VFVHTHTHTRSSVHTGNALFGLELLSTASQVGGGNRSTWNRTNHGCDPPGSRFTKNVASTFSARTHTHAPVTYVCRREIGVSV